ncbi:MAG: AtpZ/AtpI family protein [Pirellulaceae bacterium]|jgi:hypothetical protein|nr:AtpZ/AtpI family protein [Pirellulaceae bacterium]MDP7015067.1 AtpZ/AtpI family protein [Pirellulaceae bacterium]
MAEAMSWVSRVMTVSLEMVLPGIAGRWVDGRLDTGSVFTFAGFAMGMVVGIYHLLSMTGAASKSAGDDPNSREEDRES